MSLPKAELECWMREFYFSSTIDLGSSGVSTYSFGDLRKLLNITMEEMDFISFDDSKTFGSDGLRSAIANRWGDGDITPVMVANGSNEMLYHIMTTNLNQGDEVVLLDPIYHALSAVAEVTACNIKYWRLKPENNFLPDIEDLKKLVTPNTKMIVVNFPHNPTGVTISRAQQKELIAVAAQCGAYLVWDAAFEDLVFGEALPNPFYDYKQSISVGTLSKSYGLPGLRIGWCFAPQEILNKCVQLRDYTTLYVSPLVEFVGEKVIENMDLILKPKLNQVSNNYERLFKWIECNSDKVVWSNPKGGVSSFVRISGVDDVERFCRSLAEETGVMLVPGKCFGNSEYIRLGFGEDCNKFNDGLDRLDSYLKKYVW